MKQAVRAIIIHDNNILVMKRNKFGKEYYTLIGGHVELGESHEVALLREIHEETMVHVAHPRLVYVEHAGSVYGTQYVFLCEYVSGVPVLHPHADEVHINKLGQNIYTPMWLPLAQLESVPFLSEKLKHKILHALKTEFPKEPETFTTQ
jgi:8-oxo-dGTP pyrophosphatase MutT (NUDIX family)